MRTPDSSPPPGPFVHPSDVPGPVDRPPGEVRMRAVPRQQRARAAVQAILRATGELLDDAGFDALTTSAVAERAQVNIATLYRYFPDKYALIEALALSIESERIEKIAPLLAALGTGSDWRLQMRSVVEKLLELRLKRTGVKGLRRALHSAPQLWKIEREGVGRMSERLASALQVRAQALSQVQADRIATTLLGLLIGLLDQAMLEPVAGRAILSEGLLAFERYLAPYLD